MQIIAVYIQTVSKSEEKSDEMKNFFFIIFSSFTNVEHKFDYSLHDLRLINRHDSF